MKDQKLKEEFLVLRAQGQSFEKIAKQLKVSKQTLINWSREFRYEISNMRACRLEELQEKYLIAKEKRIALFGERLKAIEKELCERDLSDVPTAKLFDLLARYAGALKAEAEPLGFMGEADIRYQKEFDARLQQLYFENLQGPKVNRFLTDRKMTSIKPKPIGLKCEWYISNITSAREQYSELAGLHVENVYRLPKSDMGRNNKASRTDGRGACEQMLAVRQRRT